MKRVSAADRNKGPILEVMRELVPLDRSIYMLEVASGGGTHAAYISQAFPNITWQPSDIEQRCLDSIAACIKATGVRNVRPAVRIDTSQPWQQWAGHQPESCDMMMCVNMIHISPIRCTQGMMEAAGVLLKTDGQLVAYGPFSIHGVISPESNVRFDEHLRAQNPEWGLRDVDYLTEVAQKQGLQFQRMVDMPANNKILVFKKGSSNDSG
ncbi:methyltransferase-like 26 isoform X2 [Branchiostoma floridae x Branchiostoma japonicum]